MCSVTTGPLTLTLRLATTGAASTIDLSVTLAQLTQPADGLLPSPVPPSPPRSPPLSAAWNSYTALSGTT